MSYHRFNLSLYIGKMIRAANNRADTLKRLTRDL